MSRPVVNRIYGTGPCLAMMISLENKIDTKSSIFNLVLYDSPILSRS